MIILHSVLLLSRRSGVERGGDAERLSDVNLGDYLVMEVVQPHRRGIPWERR